MVAKSVLREAVRAPAGALATAVSNQPLRPRNGLCAAATGLGRQSFSRASKRL